MDVYFRHDQKCFNFRVAGIIKKDHQVLLSKFNDFYTLPGGRVKFGETTEQAIKRKIVEEIGIKVNINKLLSINENFFEYGEDDYHEVLFVYLCEAQNSADMDENEIIKDKFIYKSINDLVNLNLKPEFLLEELKKLPERISHNINR